MIGMTRWVAVLAPLIISTASLAGSLCTESYCQGRIEKLYVNTNGDVYIASAGDVSKLHCKPLSDVYIVLSKSTPGYDAMYAGLLAFQLSGDPVTLRVDGKSATCTLSYVVFEKK